MSNDEPKEFPYWLISLVKISVVVALLITLLVFSFYFYKFGNLSFTLSSEKGDWGTFGDYVGGILFL